MGKKLKLTKIELPPEAVTIIRKCTNRGLIMTRKGDVFEMRPGAIYKITDDCIVLSHTPNSEEDLTKEDLLNIRKWQTATSMMIEGKLRTNWSDSELATGKKLNLLEERLKE